MAPNQILSLLLHISEIPTGSPPIRGAK